MSTNNNCISPIQKIFAQVMCAAAKGNVVQLVVVKTQDGDKDLGIPGTETETLLTISPEPFINALKISAIQKSGGAFRYSDETMFIVRSAISDDIGLSQETQFVINGIRYFVISVQPGPSGWDFVVRRKAAEPVTP